MKRTSRQFESLEDRKLTAFAGWTAFQMPSYQPQAMQQAQVSYQPMTIQSSADVAKAQPANVNYSGLVHQIQHSTAVNHAMATNAVFSSYANLIRF